MCYPQKFKFLNKKERFKNIHTIRIDKCSCIWGYNWNDKPYKHNAEDVYDQYVVDIIEFPITPEYYYTYKRNSPYLKEDFKN